MSLLPHSLMPRSLLDLPDEILTLVMGPDGWIADDPFTVLSVRRSCRRLDTIHCGPRTWAYFFGAESFLAATHHHQWWWWAPPNLLLSAQPTPRYACQIRIDLCGREVERLKPVVAQVFTPLFHIVHGVHELSVELHMAGTMDDTG